MSSSLEDPNLLDSTNVYALRCREGVPTGLPTPLSEHKRVRQLEFHGRDKKRLRLASPSEERGKMVFDMDSDDYGEDEDDRIRAPCRYSIYRMQKRVRMAGPSNLSRQLQMPTRSILQSFVSSHTSDVFKCDSMDETTFTTLPYACSYSHAAKRGRAHHLAVATEQGTLHILNTVNRPDRDIEPQRVTLQPHQNGIFDIKWSPSDTLLATASGDQSIRITTLASSVLSSERTVHLLGGHQSTVKCVAWDPSYDGTLLCSGSRDGSIRLWDLRVGESCEGLADNRMLMPVLTITKAHESDVKAPKPKGRSRRVMPGAPAKGITNLLYTDNHPYGIVSSDSFDGILKLWDVRLPVGDTPSKRGTKTAVATRPTQLFTSSCDPTTYGGTRRARGITALAAGSGPSAGHLYALGTDSRVHTYAVPSLEPLSGYYSAELGAPDPYAHTHVNMQTNSFYVRLAASPCGRWLASGNASDGKAYLFDIGNAASAARARDATAWRSGWEGGVELRGQTGEVGAMDWADGMLATCADDGTVRIWRPDVDVSRQCFENPEEMKWKWAWALNALS